MSAGCSSCGATLGARNRSGLCKPCLARRNATDPAMKAKMVTALRAKMLDPEYRAAHVARCIKNGSREDIREIRRQHGFARAARLRKANAAMTPEMRAENGRKRSETVMSWCPPEWRARYRELCKRGRKAADARRIVLHLAAGGAEPILYAQQKSKLAWCPPGRLDEYRSFAKALGAAEARRIIEADMTPFERQLARVRGGAKLVEVRPLRRLAEPTVTLGGVPSSYL